MYKSFLISYVNRKYVKNVIQHHQNYIRSNISSRSPLRRFNNIVFSRSNTIFVSADTLSYLSNLRVRLLIINTVGVIIRLDKMHRKPQSPFRLSMRHGGTKCKRNQFVGARNGWWIDRTSDFSLREREQRPKKRKKKDRRVITTNGSTTTNRMIPSCTNDPSLEEAIPDICMQRSFKR